MIALVDRLVVAEQADVVALGIDAELLVVAGRGRLAVLLILDPAAGRQQGIQLRLVDVDERIVLVDRHDFVEAPRTMTLGQPLLFIGIQGPSRRQDHLLHVNVRDLELAEVAAALLHVVFLDHVQGHFWSDAAGRGLLGLDRDGVAGVRLNGHVAPHAAAAQQHAIQFPLGQHCAQVAVFQLLGLD